MMKKNIVILGVLAIMLVILSGLHFRVVTKIGDESIDGIYQECDTVELHNFRIEKNESNANQNITCFSKFNMWLAW